MTEHNIFKKETIITVDGSDLDDFIAKSYNLSGFEGTLESPNDSTHRFTVDGKVSEYDQKAIDDIKSRESCEYYMLGLVLNDLCKQGLVEPGTYLVEVRW